MTSLLFIDTTKLYIIRKGLEDKCHGFYKYEVLTVMDSENASYNYIVTFQNQEDQKTIQIKNKLNS